MYVGSPERLPAWETDNRSLETDTDMRSRRGWRCAALEGPVVMEEALYVSNHTDTDHLSIHNPRNGKDTNKSSMLANDLTIRRYLQNRRPDCGHHARLQGNPQAQFNQQTNQGEGL